MCVKAQVKYLHWGRAFVPAGQIVICVHLGIWRFMKGLDINSNCTGNLGHEKVQQSLFPTRQLAAPKHLYEGCLPQLGVWPKGGHQLDRNHRKRWIFLADFCVVCLYTNQASACQCGLFLWSVREYKGVQNRVVHLFVSYCVYFGCVKTYW